VGFTVTLRFDDRAAGLDLVEPWEAVLTSLAPPFDPAHLVAVDHDPRDLRTDPPPGARYVVPPVDLGRAAWFKAAEADLIAHLQIRRKVTVQRNKALKLVSRPGESAEQFAGRCGVAADAAADAEAAKVRDTLTARMDRLRDAVSRAEDRVETADTAADAARNDEVVNIAGKVLGNLLGGRRSVRGMAGDVRSAASRRGQSQRAQQRIEEAQHRLAEKVDDLAALEQELAATLVEIDDRWAAVAAAVEPVDVGHEKSDIRIDHVFVVWVPVA